MEENSWHDGVATPALLRSARHAYGRSIRRELAARGFDDVPTNGPFVLGGLRIYGPGPQSSAIAALGMTKQAGSQLIDALVVRGYLERIPDLEDRRRMNLRLTDRGRDAAAAVKEGVDAVDAELLADVGEANLAVMRAGLAKLSELGSTS